MLRSILERLSRGVILKRKLPATFNNLVLFVSPEGGLKYWKPTLKNIDPMLFNIANRFIATDDTIWDVGANVGLFTFSAIAKAGKKGRAVAVEADIVMANLLKKSVTLNADYQVDIVPLAVADKNGVVEFNIAKRARATNFISYSKGSTQTGGVREKYVVPVVSLDYLSDFYPIPHFIKIDVEGAEAYVIKGATQLIKSARPLILIEISDDNVEFSRSFFVENNYALYDAVSLKKIETPTDNTLCIPQEKVNQFAASLNQL